MESDDPEAGEVKSRVADEGGMKDCRKSGAKRVVAYGRVALGGCRPTSMGH